MATEGAFAVNTYAYTQSTHITECLTRLADQGYRGLELMVYPGHLWPGELDSGGRRKLRALMEGLGLRLVALNMPNIDINIAGASQEMRSYSLSLLTAFLELAGDLGAKGMIIGPGKPNPLFPAAHEVLLGHFCRALDRLVPLSEKAGPELWVENMPFAFLPDMDGLMQAVETYGSDRLGVCYDVANAWFIDEDLRHGLVRAKDRLRLVHVSDTGQQVYRHGPVGSGTVPFASIPPILEEIGYSESPVLEVISATPDRDIAESARRLASAGWPCGASSQ